MFERLFNYPAELFASGELLLLGGDDWLRWLVLGALLLFLVSGLLGRRVLGLSRGRRAVLTTLQVLAVAQVVVLLLEPSLKVERLRPGANSVAVLVDTSRSMELADVPGSGSRAAQAQRLAGELARGLQSSADVVLYSFDGHARRRDVSEAGEPLTGGGGETRLLKAVDEVLTAFQGAALAGVVVISDGADTSASTDLAAIGGSGVPVHTVGLGALTLSGETLLEDVQVPAEVPVGSEVAATVQLRHAGGGRALVRVLDQGSLLTAVPVVLPADQEVVRARVSFDSGRAGIRDLRFEVVPDGPDALAANNSLSRLVTVSERARKVLYLEGEPRWEYKFLRRAIAGDDVLELKSYLKTTDRKSYRQGVSGPEELKDGLPTALRELYGYDVVVLGSLAAAAFDEAQHALLERFVSERGGSLLVLAGRRSLADGGWEGRPLERLLPVALAGGGSFGSQRGRAVVTRAGELSAITALPALPDADDEAARDPWATLPELGDHQPLGRLKPAATTLLHFRDAQTSVATPLLVTQPYGLGNAAVLATSSTWRWQTRTPEGDERHQRFWRQLLRQLAADAPQPRQVAVSAGLDNLELRVLLRTPEFEPEPAALESVQVTGPGGSTTPLLLEATAMPGELLGRLDKTEAGVHKVDVTLRDGTAYTRFARVGGVSGEDRTPLQNVTLLRRLAALTGGAYWTPESAAGIPETLSFTGAGIREQQLLPLWNMPLLLLLLLLTKAGEWLLRRRWSRI